MTVWNSPGESKNSCEAPACVVRWGAPPAARCSGSLVLKRWSSACRSCTNRRSPRPSTGVTVPMELVEARGITPHVPADLWALRWRRRPAAAGSVRICAVRDLGLSGRARVTAQRDGADRLFAEVRPVLADADVVLGNLESPLAESL